MVSLDLSSALTWTYQGQYVLSVFLLLVLYVDFFLLINVCQFLYKPEPILTET